MAQIPMTKAPAQETNTQSYDVIPDDTIVPVEVLSVEIREFPPEFRAKYNVKDTHEVSFAFKVTDGEFKGKRLWGSARPVFDDSDTCRLRLWTQEILGLDKLPEDFVFDTDMLPGSQCRILVSERRRKSDGKITNKVKDVLRATRASHTTGFVTVDDDDLEPF